MSGATKELDHNAYICGWFNSGEVLGVDRFVYLHTDGKWYGCDDTAKMPMGKTRKSTSAADESVEVLLCGPIVAAISDGSSGIGKPQKCVTDGKVSDHTTDNVYVVGWALSTATADGQEIMLLYYPHVTNDISELD